jgi:hypothetical protein
MIDAAPTVDSPLPTIDAPLVPGGCGGGATAANLVSSTPADGATRIDPTTTITLTFDGAIDPSLVTADHIALLAPHASLSMPTTLVYDPASCRITITPVIALSNSSTYRIHIDGVVGSPVRRSFTTRHVNWNERDGIDTSTGFIVNGELHLLDAEMRMTHQTIVNSAGPDHMLGTPDDQLGQEWALSYSADGHTITVESPGMDGMLGTYDDTYTQQTWDDPPDAPYTRLTMSEGGVIGQLQQKLYDEHGRVSDWEFWDSVGDDGIPFTDDDHAFLHYVIHDTGLEREVLTFGEPGPDGVLDTPDDPIDGIYDVTFDSFYRPLVGTSMNPDHVIEDVFTYSYDPVLGLPLASATYTGPSMALWTNYITSYDGAGNEIAEDGYFSNGAHFDHIHYMVEP